MTEEEIIPPVEETPAPAPAPEKNPLLKSEQCTGRATIAEKTRIEAVLAARRPPTPEGAAKAPTYDIVRLTLDLLDHVEKDNFPFQSFKTK